MMYILSGFPKVPAQQKTILTYPGLGYTNNLPELGHPKKDYNIRITQSNLNLPGNVTSPVIPSMINSMFLSVGKSVVL